MKIRFLPVALAALLFTAPAIAQEGNATLRIESGSAMVSTGGEFTSAVSGTEVAPGTRVMLAEGSRASLVYPNGCSQALPAAGVYSVAPTCVAAAAGSGAAATAAGGAGAGAAGAAAGGATAGASGMAAVGILAGAAAAGAAALNSMDKVPGPPEPPVSR